MCAISVKQNYSRCKFDISAKSGFFLAAQTVRFAGLSWKFRSPLLPPALTRKNSETTQGKQFIANIDFMGPYAEKTKSVLFSQGREGPVWRANGSIEVSYVFS